MNQDATLILSLYPNARGLGYVCLEAPQRLLDSGVLTVRPLSNERILVRVAKFVEFYHPTLIVIRDSDTLTTRRAKRVQGLMDTITAYAKSKNIKVAKYTRQQIRDVFEVHGAQTKYEIAQQIIHWFPELAPRAPKIRKPWMDEDYNMGLFDALSVAITHLYLTK